MIYVCWCVMAAMLTGGAMPNPDRAKIVSLFELFLLRVFLARRTRVARILISTPRMVSKLLIVGDSAVRLLVTLGARSAW